MARVLVLVLVALISAAAAQDRATTLDDVFLEEYQEDTYQVLYSMYLYVISPKVRALNSELELISGNSTRLPPLSAELISYIDNIQSNIRSEFASDLANVTVRSICDDLNKHCGDYLQSAIMNLTIEPSNSACVTTRLVETLKLKFKMAVEAGLRRTSRECVQQRLSLCMEVHRKCTTAHEELIRTLLVGYIEYQPAPGRSSGSTILEILEELLYNNTAWLSTSYSSTIGFLRHMLMAVSHIPSVDPLLTKNLVLSNLLKKFLTTILRDYGTIQSHEQLPWGIIESNEGQLGSPCSNVRDAYPSDSKEYIVYRFECFAVNVMQSSIDLLRCAYASPTWKPLNWSLVPSTYFHSQCLCVAYNGTDCGVKAPQDVDPRLYCLSVLIRDFQMQVTYRPAVTYLDYAFYTRVPVCQLLPVIQRAFLHNCEGFKPIKLASCYLKGLLNDQQFNCSERRLVSTYNRTELCGLLLVLDYDLCDAEVDVEVPVAYYRAGDSPLVLVLTYLDVAVRVLTLVTYVACAQLRNLPGKVLIGYLTTSLLRLLVVRAILGDMALAVRLDVAADLASTLWLTSYLHFLTVSITTLRLPNSLSPTEALHILLRYSLLGWVLPAALSAAFFYMDETVESHVQIGQLLFLLCNYVALFANLYMLYASCSFYYEVKEGARELLRGRKRDVIAAIFNFAVKASLLSGAGITLRLAFTQIQGLEQLLDYYYAIGTLQGLLVFLLYGCNSEARAFWGSNLQRLRRQNVPV